MMERVCGVSHVQLDRIKYLNEWFEEECGPSWRVQFPFQGQAASGRFGTVAVELDPGETFPIHIDNEDELVIVLSGMIEAVAGEDDLNLEASGVLFIPATEPHGFRNVGDSVARLLSVFPQPSFVSRFGKPVMPLSQRVRGAIPVDQLS